MNRVAVTGLGLGVRARKQRRGMLGAAGGGGMPHPPAQRPGNRLPTSSAGARGQRLCAAGSFHARRICVLERFAQLAAVAAREAVAQSGLTFTEDLADRTAVITGSSIGGQFSEEEGYIRLYREKNSRIAPLTIPRTMSNAGASRISLEFGIHGPGYTRFYSLLLFESCPGAGVLDGA